MANEAAGRTHCPVGHLTASQLTSLQTNTPHLTSELSRMRVYPNHLSSYLLQDVTCLCSWAGRIYFSPARRCVRARRCFIFLLPWWCCMAEVACRFFWRVCLGHFIWIECFKTVESFTAGSREKQSPHRRYEQVPPVLLASYPIHRLLCLFPL